MLDYKATISSSCHLHNYLFMYHMSDYLLRRDEFVEVLRIKVMLMTVQFSIRNQFQWTDSLEPICEVAGVSSMSTGLAPSEPVRKRIQRSHIAGFISVGFCWNDSRQTRFINSKYSITLPQSSQYCGHV